MIDTARPNASPRPDICVILNTRSGKRRETARAQLDAAFARYPGRFHLMVLVSGKQIAEATRKAIAEGYETIVAAGGDGTISGVASLVAPAGRRFGISPFGTFNYFARSIGMPEDVDAAVDVLITGEETPTSICEVNGEGFLNNASLGAYAAILQKREKIYSRWGRSRIAAYWSVVVTLLKMRNTHTMTLTLDGEVHRLRTPLAFIAGNAYQLEAFGLPGTDCVQSGKLALFIAPDRTGPALLAFAARLALGGLEKSRDFSYFCGQEIRIETKRQRRLVARDGEKTRMTGPFCFRMHPGALRLIAPTKEPEPK